MDHSAANTTELTDSAAQVCLSALSEQFAARGLCRAALSEAEERVLCEAKTRELAPQAYRLSTLSDAAVTGLYRRGKDCMNGEDLLRYVEEGRCMGQGERDYADYPSIYEEAARRPEPIQKALTRTEQQKPMALPTKGIRMIKERFPMWFNASPADTSREHKKFPFSAFAAVVAVAVSMMLIVASALMVTGAETRISRLNSEISKLSSEVSDLRSDLESDCDLMEIRRIATEEYGMVEEDYLKSQYLTMDSTEDVEIYEDEKDGGIGLGAILSAIGLK